MFVGVCLAGRDERQNITNGMLSELNSRLARLHAAFLKMSFLFFLMPHYQSQLAREHLIFPSFILSLFLVARKDIVYHINSDRSIHSYTTLQFMYIYIHTEYTCMYAWGKYPDTMLVATCYYFLLIISEEILRSIKYSDLARYRHVLENVIMISINLLNTCLRYILDFSSLIPLLN